MSKLIFITQTEKIEMFTKIVFDVLRVQHFSSNIYTENEKKLISFNHQLLDSTIIVFPFDNTRRAS